GMRERPGLPQLQLARQQRVVALDDGAAAGLQDRPELRDAHAAEEDVDAVAAVERGVEVVEVGAAVEVELEAPKDRAVGDDAEREAGEHRARGQRAVRVLERATVELAERRDAREAERRRAGRWAGVDERVRGGGEIATGHR